MCGVTGYIGKPNANIFAALMEESKVRGLHHLGYKTVGNACIAHARYCTSGLTNQPITSGKFTSVFNGVIDMGTKKDMEKRWKIHMQTDNDGEIPMLLVTQGVPLLEFIINLKGSYAGLWLTQDKLVAVRNDRRPLWKSVQNNVTYFASTEDILVRVGLKSNNVILEPYKLHSWKIKN